MEQNQETAKRLNYQIGDSVVNPQLSIDTYFTVHDTRPNEVLIMGHFGGSRDGTLESRWVADTEVWPMTNFFLQSDPDKRLAALSADIAKYEDVGLEVPQDWYDHRTSITDYLSHLEKPLPQPVRGLMPRSTHVKIRIHAIDEAVERYELHQLPVPPEWRAEQQELTQWLAEQPN